MSQTDERTKYKAQVYDVALDAFFKAGNLDALALDRSREDIIWDIGEAVVAAVASGLTYKSRDQTRRFEAATLLRTIADQVEEDGLASLEWGYLGDLNARHAWRPDIRASAGLEELDHRTDAAIEAMMRPARALSVPDRRAIVCQSFMRMALAHCLDLIDQAPDHAATVRATTRATLKAAVEALDAAPEGPAVNHDQFTP